MRTTESVTMRDQSATLQSLSILYIGSNSGTCRHRALALRRLGHKVTILDPYSFVPSRRYVDKWIFETGGVFLEGLVERGVLGTSGPGTVDLVYVDGGELVGPNLV